MLVATMSAWALLRPCRCLGLCRGGLGVCRIGLSLFLLARRLVGLRLRLCLRIGGSLAFARLAILVNLFDGDLSRIFRSLHGLPGLRDQLLLI